MKNLIDGDFASNNGGWQWCAGTGTDSLSNLRIFNPYLQSRRYDADGVFIRQWVPELREVKGDAIHSPFRDLRIEEFNKLGYPKPIVDHERAKREAERLLGSYLLG